MKYPKILLCTVLALGLSGIVLPGALAGGRGFGQNPGIVNPQSRVYGSSYGELAAEWLQWALSIPAAQNPIVDETGEWSGVGQHGPVWFLAGNFGGVSERTVSVPAGTPLFFPIVNSFMFRTDPEEPCGRREIQQYMDEMLAGSTVSADIDGRPVRNLHRYYAASPLVDITLPPENLWWEDYGLPAGPYGPSMNVGYFLLLEPLSVGQHVIHFQGTVPEWGMELDVTYDLLVVANSCASDEVGPCNDKKRDKH